MEDPLIRLRLEVEQDEQQREGQQGQSEEYPRGERRPLREGGTTATADQQRDERLQQQREERRQYEEERGKDAETYNDRIQRMRRERMARRERDRVQKDPRQQFMKRRDAQKAGEADRRVADNARRQMIAEKTAGRGGASKTILPQLAENALDRAPQPSGPLGAVRNVVSRFVPPSSTVGGTLVRGAGYGAAAAYAARKGVQIGARLGAATTPGEGDYFFRQAEADVSSAIAGVKAYVGSFGEATDVANDIRRLGGQVGLTEFPGRSAITAVNTKYKEYQSLLDRHQQRVIDQDSARALGDATGGIQKKVSGIANDIVDGLGLAGVRDESRKIVELFMSNPVP